MSEPHEEWSAQEPAPDFADKVMGQIDAEARVPLARRGATGGSWRASRRESRWPRASRWP